MEEVVEQAPQSEWIEGRQAMQTPEDVQAMLKLASLGWGAKRISRELGCSRNTVRSYLRHGGWQPGWERASAPSSRASSADTVSRPPPGIASTAFRHS